MRFTYVELLLTAWQGVGLSLLSGFLYVLCRDNIAVGRGRNLSIGVAFGLTAIAAMLSPIKAGNGIYVDVRCLMIGFGTLLAGPLGLVAVLPCAALRWWTGGEVAAGILGIVLASAIGLAAHYGWRTVPEQRSLGGYCAMGTMIACHLASAFFVQSTNWLVVGAKLFAVAAPVYALGGLLLGIVVRRKTTQKRT